MTTEIHVFEQAGLGKAPFRFRYAYEKRGPIVVSEKMGVQMTVGSPGQPMGTCNYCGQGIATCCVIESADGRRFEVGSDCVMKTGDVGLKKLVNKEMRSRTKTREQERINEVKTRLESDKDFRAKLTLITGVSPYHANALGWCEWMMQNSGHSGRMKVVRYIKRNNL